MKTTKHTFIVTGKVPAGVTMAEFADHLADAHRLTVDSYDGSDPMSVAGPIRVMGAVRRTDLPSGGG